ncbi:MAG: quinol monooxygenase YgiN [Gammaproteobacteria bacterium]|jgi:quinol monooxygenase YgiN
MNEKLTIIARIEALPDQIELVKSELLKLVGPTLQENGCIQYDLHQDNKNPAVFFFYENWESRGLSKQHMKSRHLADFMKATDGSMASFSLNEVSKLAAA